MYIPNAPKLWWNHGKVWDMLWGMREENIYKILTIRRKKAFHRDDKCHWFCPHFSFIRNTLIQNPNPKTQIPQNLNPKTSTLKPKLNLKPKHWVQNKSLKKPVCSLCYLQHGIAFSSIKQSWKTPWNHFSLTVYIGLRSLEIVGRYFIFGRLICKYALSTAFIPKQSSRVALALEYVVVVFTCINQYRYVTTPHGLLTQYFAILKS